MKKKVFVTGCFDLLHSGHVAFLKEANNYGDVYVNIGNDKNIQYLKGRYPINNEIERKFMLESIKYVKECKINKGSGVIDFIENFYKLNPDIFIVNEDGDNIEKEKLCDSTNTNYIILKRVPQDLLPKRSTTNLRKTSNIPYRIDLAGGWLDQLMLNEIYPGSVITISIEPSHEFNLRSGMASSTRNKAIELWTNRIPSNDLEKLSKILFCYENPPGTKIVTGSQDAIGIVYPGLNKIQYDNNFWPVKIENILDEEKLKFIEENIKLIPLGPRNNEFDVLSKINLHKKYIKELAENSNKLWNSILNLDIKNFGKSFLNSFKTQIKIFPLMLNDEISKTINTYKDDVIGYKLSGSGGGGYLILVTSKRIDGSIKIKIRR